MEDGVCEETRWRKKLTENGDREGNTDKVRIRKEANIGPAKEAVSLHRDFTKNIKKHDYISSFAEYVEGKIINLGDTPLHTLPQMRIQTVLFEI
jgi:hypothetical protein